MRTSYCAKFMPVAFLGWSLAPGAGCQFESHAGPMIEADDVELAVPHAEASRGGGPVRGDIQSLISDTARDVNGWVGGLVRGTAQIVSVLGEHRETSRDGKWKVYGPFDDEDGRDVGWLVRIAGDGGTSEYEIKVGKSGATEDEMVFMIAGGITVDGDVREGQFDLYLDVFETHPQLKDEDDEHSSFAGVIATTFSRDISSKSKTVELAFDGVHIEEGGQSPWFSDETYRYQREPDGSGAFYLALHGTFDEDGWSGPEWEKMVLEAGWTAELAGRTSGAILEVDGTGDLAHGDLLISECFASDGYLTWREINPEYAALMPDYNLGDPRSCVTTAP